MKIAIFDIDGTLTDTRVWGGIFDYFWFKKSKLLLLFRFFIVNIPRLFLYKMKLLSSINFRRKWSAEMALFFKGIHSDEVEKIWDWILHTRMIGMLRLDIVSVLQKHVDEGDLVVLLSGGPTQLIQHLCRYLGGPIGIGTDYEIVNDIYTGKTSNQPCVGPRKVEYLRKYLTRNKYEIDWGRSYAYGDSLGDLSMLALVGNPVAVYPDESLIEIAIKNEWQIIK